MLIILALIGLLIWMWYSHQQRIDKNAVGIIKTESGENSVDYANIPGFKTLIFTADSVEQSVDFFNPSENRVNLQLSLSLADGTQLYESGLIEPGKTVQKIKLSQALKVGEYKNATLHYKCYTPEGKASNAANITFDLIVKERKDNQ